MGNSAQNGEILLKMVKFYPKSGIFSKNRNFPLEMSGIFPKKRGLDTKNQGIPSNTPRLIFPEKKMGIWLKMVKFHSEPGIPTQNRWDFSQKTSLGLKTQELPPTPPSFFPEKRQNPAGIFPGKMRISAEFRRVFSKKSRILTEFPEFPQPPRALRTFSRCLPAAPPPALPCSPSAASPSASCPPSSASPGRTGTTGAWPEPPDSGRSRVPELSWPPLASGCRWKRGNPGSPSGAAPSTRGGSEASRSPTQVRIPEF